MVKPKKYKAKDVKGRWVTGWYVPLHFAIMEHDKVVGYNIVPHLFNDEHGERSEGSYWHEIIPETLQEINEQNQLTFFSTENPDPNSWVNKFWGNEQEKSRLTKTDVSTICEMQREK